MMTYLQMLLRTKQLFSFGLRIQLLTCYLCVNNLTGSLYKQGCFWRASNLLGSKLPSIVRQ